MISDIEALLPNICLMRKGDCATITGFRARSSAAHAVARLRELFGAGLEARFRDSFTFPSVVIRKLSKKENIMHSLTNLKITKLGRKDFPKARSSVYEPIYQKIRGLRKGSVLKIEAKGEFNPNSFAMNLSVHPEFAGNVEARAKPREGAVYVRRIANHRW